MGEQQQKKINKYKKLIKEAQESQNSPEEDHIIADEYLCELLESLGYGEVVEEWRKVHKWYS